MIKINLLRNSGLAQQSAGAVDSASIADAEIKRTAMIKLLAIFALTAALFAYEQSTLSEAKATYAEIQQTLAGLRAEKAKYGDHNPKMEKFAKEKQRLDQDLEIVRSLARYRLREVKTLDAIQTLMPERAWLKRLTIEGNKVHMEGYATLEEAVTQLIRALESSAFFSEVEPRSITQEQIGSARAVKFELDYRAGKAGD